MLNYGIYSVLLRYLKWAKIAPITQMKWSKITPVNKSGERSLMDNYKPISVLRALSKVCPNVWFTPIRSKFTATLEEITEISLTKS